jgi:integrase
MERTTLSTAFKYAVEKSLTKINPFNEVNRKKKKQKKADKIFRMLTPAERRRLLESCNKIDEERGNHYPRFYDIVYLLLKTGLRHDEMCKLEWNDIKWNRNVVEIKPKRIIETRTIPIPFGHLDKIRELCKGRRKESPLFSTKKVLEDPNTPRFAIREQEELLNIKVGEVDLKKKVITHTEEYDWFPKASSGTTPISPKLKKLLDSLDRKLRINEGKRFSNFVFSHHDGGSCRLRLMDLLRDACARANIKGHFRIHDLRHNCAMSLRSKGVPLETIKDFLRHSDIRETLIYARYDESEGVKAATLLDEEF